MNICTSDLCELRPQDADTQTRLELKVEALAKSHVETLSNMAAKVEQNTSLCITLQHTLNNVAKRLEDVTELLSSRGGKGGGGGGRGGGGEREGVGGVHK